MILEIGKWGVIASLMVNLTGTSVARSQINYKPTEVINVVAKNTEKLEIKTTILNDQINEESLRLDSQIIKVTNSNNKAIELYKLRKRAVSSLKRCDITLSRGSYSKDVMSIPEAFKVLTGTSFKTLGEYNIRSNSRLTAVQINKIFAGTGLANMGTDFVRAEKKYKVSALVLMGIAVHESNWGYSNLAKTKNNVVGFQAYDSNVGAARTFSTKGDCIMVVASALNGNYLTTTGPYYNGLTLKDVNTRYASDKIWHTGVEGAMVVLLSRL